MKEIHPCSVSDSREKGRQPTVAEPSVAAGSTVVCKGVDFDEDQRTKQKRDRSRSRSRRSQEDEPELTTDGESGSWIPAIQGLTGTRMFLPELGCGNGKGLVHESWSTKQLLFSQNRWAKLVKGADSDKEMKEGIHYEFTDWKPTTIRFARERRNPIRGMEFDNAITMRATKILVHVGKIRGSGRFAVAEDSR